MEVTSRAEAVRLACILLTGGAAADLPDNWQALDFLGDPSPAAEFGHCASELLKMSSEGTSAGPEHDKRRFHEDMSKHHNIGPKVYSYKLASGEEVKSLRVPDWADVTMVGSPCLVIMMARAPKILASQVRHLPIRMGNFCDA